MKNLIIKELINRGNPTSLIWLAKRVDPKCTFKNVQQRLSILRAHFAYINLESKTHNIQCTRTHAVMRKI